MRPKPVVSTRSGKGIHGEEHVINGESKAKPVIAAVHAPAPLAKTVTTAAHVDIKPAQPPSVSPTELLISEAKPIKEDIVMVNGENGKSETGTVT